MNGTYRIHGNCLDVLPTLERPNLIIADPIYGDMATTNRFIAMARELCLGPTFVFEYAENIQHIQEEPDQVLFWVKPISTKNTSKRYSRFVEVILAYDLGRSPFHALHWSVKTGVFTDTPIVNDHVYKKPPSLIEKLIRVNSNENDIVIDPFAGSFTVEGVCLATNRRCISIEKTSIEKDTTKKEL